MKFILPSLPNNVKVILTLDLVALGFLFAVLYFGLYHPVLPSLTAQAAETTGVIIGAGATFLAVVAALFSDELKIRPKPLIIISDIPMQTKQYEQPLHFSDGTVTDAHNYDYIRLNFSNEGIVTAEDVEVYVSNIYENGAPRQGFLAVPLMWTHSGLFSRKFHPNQWGYLDFCRVDLLSQDKIPQLVLRAGHGVSAYQDIHEGDTKIELTIFDKSGQTKKYSIDIYWEKTEPKLEARNILEV